MKKIVFLHIQKTAGNSLHQILYNNRIGYLHFHFNEGKALTRSKLEDIQKKHPIRITGIGGHQLDCTKKDAFFGPEQFTFTVLRDPIDRYLSFYNHMVQKSDYNFSFDEFLEGEEQFNYQTKCIAREENAEAAIAILKSNFDFVGIFEQMDKTLIQLSHRLDIDVDEKHLNKSTQSKLSRTDLTEAQLAKAQQNNALDWKVYQAGLSLFNEYKSVTKSRRTVSTVTKFLRRLLKKYIGWKMKD